MELEDLVQRKPSHPRTSFVFIFNAAHQGAFRSGILLAHEVDVIFKVKSGLAKAIGCFHAGGELLRR
jgi:hypothetical protein